MTTFKQDDRVRINWPADDELHGRTGTIEQQSAYLDGAFTMRLDKPLDNGIETVDMWPDCLERLQVIGTDTSHLYDDGLIKSIAADATAVVAAVHVRIQMLIDVACSRHGHRITYDYGPGTTNAELEIFRDRAAPAAYVHATDCHTDTLDGS